MRRLRGLSQEILGLVPMIIRSLIALERAITDIDFNLIERVLKRIRMNKLVQLLQSHLVERAVNEGVHYFGSDTNRSPVPPCSRELSRTREFGLHFGLCLAVPKWRGRTPFVVLHFL